MKTLERLALALEANKTAQEAAQKILDPLKEKEEKLRELLLLELKKQRLATFKSEDGSITFSRAYRSSLGIIEPVAALKWAVENDCAKVDQIKANKLLKGAGALPEGFEQKETEYLVAKQS